MIWFGLVWFGDGDVYFIEVDIRYLRCPSIIVLDGKRYSRSPTLNPTNPNQAHCDVFLNPPTLHPTDRSSDSRRPGHSDLHG